MDPERLEKLTRKVGGRFRLTSLLQKRMAELVKGSPAMLEVTNDVADNLFEIALREIEAGRIELIRPWMAEDALHTPALPAAAPEKN
ncbi:MAG TPA: DNA-directed RNA polymerase subunit omega [Candidatus Brocadiia bacterium]|nr:DNA-directed RNA polymerase subunit omega [Candidatus Brocadiia bacterium]